MTTTFEGCAGRDDVDGDVEADFEEVVVVEGTGPGRRGT